MPHHAHTTNEADANCDAAKGSWLRKNLTLQTILTLVVLVGGMLAGVYAFASKADAGAKAALKVELIERDYIGKREFEGAVGGVNARMDRLDRKFDKLTNVILKRMPDDEE